MPRGGGKLAMAVTLVERDLSFMPRMGDSFPCQQWEACGECLEKFSYQSRNNRSDWHVSAIAEGKDCQLGPGRRLVMLVLRPRVSLARQSRSLARRS